MEKLELKHIAPYLPYGIYCQLMGEPTHNIIEIVGANIDYVEIHEIGRTITDEYPYCDITPKLRPLYHLTQEIEHNGERFVPALELVKEKEKHGKWKDHAPSINYTYGIIKMPFGELLKVSKLDTWVIMLSIEDPSRSEYFIIQKLFEWHFDVFGLLEKGLAIEKK